jgi:chromosome segregation ATPase
MSKKRITFLIPEETAEKAKAKLEHGEMSDRLRDTLNRIAHGADVAEQTRVKEALQQKRREKREIESEIETLRRNREEKEREIERLEERLDTLANQDGEYEGVLKALESLLEDGRRVFVGHGQVKEAAAVGECSQEDVIDDLKDRNPTVPEEQFTDGAKSGVQ